MPAVSNLLRRDGRAIDASSFNLALEDLSAGRTNAGIAVDQDKALSHITVYACVSLVADVFASLPVHAFRRRAEFREEAQDQPAWLDRVNGQPNAETDGYTFWHRHINSLLLDGNSFVLVTAVDRLGLPVEVWNLNPQEVRSERRNGRLEYVWVDGTRFPRYSRLSPEGAVLHTKLFDAGGLRGISPIQQVGREEIGLGLVADKEAGRFFSEGQRLSGVIQIPGEANPEGLKQMKENWQRWHAGSSKSQLPGVLSGGATWTPLSIKPEESQFLETRKFSVQQIARLYRVPPHLVADVEKSTSWGSGIEEQNIGFHTYRLNTLMAQTESVWNQALPRGQFLRWNGSGLLRGDTLKRYQAYQIARMNGWMSGNEIRALEDMNPAEGLDGYWEPLNIDTGDSNEPD